VHYASVHKHIRQRICDFGRYASLVQKKCLY
jgi:hypothetical protein